MSEKAAYLVLLVGNIIISVTQMLSKLHVSVEASFILGYFGIEVVLKLLHDRYKLLGMFMLVWVM